MLSSFPAYSETIIRDSMHDNLCRAGDSCLIGFEMEAVSGEWSVLGGHQAFVLC